MQILGTHHLAITTTRFDRLRDFYVGTLGLPVVGGFPEHEIVFIAAGSTAIELIGEPPASEAGCEAPEADDVRAARRGWHHLAWEVADLDAAFAELVARGVAVHSPPEDFPPEAPALRIAFLRDPDGNLFELVQRAAGHQLRRSVGGDAVAPGPADAAPDRSFRSRVTRPQADTSAQAPSSSRKPHCPSSNASTASTDEPARLSSR
jgi:catechol 2,3-dioxygenase-like lactoylglutathione lyase family enzyme